MKIAIVTGGTRGLGKEITTKLLNENYYVIATYLSNEVMAKKMLNECKREHISMLTLIRHDFSNINLIDEFRMKVLEISSEIDLIVFNAGGTDRAELKNQTVHNWMKVFDLNLNVPVFLIQQLLSNFKKNSSIIFISSTMGIFPHSTSLSYGVSKAAVNALVKNLVKFLIPYNIRINAIVPGFIDTEWHINKNEEQINNIKSKISLGYFCPSINIAEFLFSVVQNNYINGQCLQIDGAYNFK